MIVWLLAYCAFNAIMAIFFFMDEDVKDIRFRGTSMMLLFGLLIFTWAWGRLAARKLLGREATSDTSNP